MPATWPRFSTSAYSHVALLQQLGPIAPRRSSFLALSYLTAERVRSSTSTTATR